MRDFDVLGVRRRLGRRHWSAPRGFGDDGWSLHSTTGRSQIIVTADTFDGLIWVHASIAHVDIMPTYRDLTMLHAAVFPDGWSYQVFSPPAEHVNIYEYALHLWGRLDREPAPGIPNFGLYGTI